jgi:hypothetical protein
MSIKLSTAQLADFEFAQLPNENANAYTKRCKDRYNLVLRRIREIRNAKSRTNHASIQALYDQEIEALESLESKLNGRINRPWNER